MKKSNHSGKLIFVFLVVTLILGIIFLANFTISINIKNDSLLDELQSKSLSVDSLMKQNLDLKKEIDSLNSDINLYQEGFAACDERDLEFEKISSDYDVLKLNYEDALNSFNLFLSGNIDPIDGIEDNSGMYNFDNNLLQLNMNNLDTSNMNYAYFHEMMHYIQDEELSRTKMSQYISIYRYASEYPSEYAMPNDDRSQLHDAYEDMADSFANSVECYINTDKILDDRVGFFRSHIIPLTPLYEQR